MNDKIENSSTSSDDTLAYEESRSFLYTSDPLTAIKAMRLRQLAVCRLKSEQEVQRMREETKNLTMPADNEPTLE